MAKKDKKNKEKADEELPSHEVLELKDEFEHEFDPHSSEQLGLGYQNTLVRKIF